MLALTLHFTSHFTSLHFTSHFTSLHFTSLHFTSHFKLQKRQKTMKKANLNKRLANAKKRLANANFKTKKARNEAIKKEINHIFKNWNLSFIPKNIFGFQVVCEWKSRGGRGFAHICKLLDSNFNAIESQQVNYINRTWERFSYETAFRVCIFNYVKKALENI